MIRVKDPKVSLKFYTEVRYFFSLIAHNFNRLSLVDHRYGTDCRYVRATSQYPQDLTPPLNIDRPTEHPASDFTLYFLAFDHSNGTATAQEKADGRFNREGILELTHNHGTECDPEFKGYASGNSEPGRGFGHIAITVPNIHEACARLERLGVPFKKKLHEGNMKNIAFALDPDGYVIFFGILLFDIVRMIVFSFSYWIEIVPQRLIL